MKSLLSLFRLTINSGETSKILAAFPFALENDVRKVIAILPASNRITSASGETYVVNAHISTNQYSVIFENEKLHIPYRIYFNEPDPKKEMRLTNVQQMILNCLYLRHHDGYVRQRRLENLVDSTASFIIPFSIQLLGEYVIEILQVLDKHVNEKTHNDYKTFVKTNSRYWQKTESRVVSYWNAYYRKKFPKLKEYVGVEIINKIKG